VIVRPFDSVDIANHRSILLAFVDNRFFQPSKHFYSFFCRPAFHAQYFCVFKAFCVRMGILFDALQGNDVITVVIVETDWWRTRVVSILGMKQKHGN
jgi:hypothetical protein